METISKVYKALSMFNNEGNLVFTDFMLSKKEDYRSDRLFAITHAQLGNGDYSGLAKEPPIEIQVIRSGRGKKKNADFDFSGGGIVLVGSFIMSQKGKLCLDRFFTSASYQHQMINKSLNNEIVWCVLINKFASGIIDIGNSDIEYDCYMEISSINRFNVKKGAVVPDVFKLTENPRGDTYFSQAFVDRYHECGLTGVEFIDVTKNTEI